MTIIVDEQCIRAGVRREGEKCPVALALQRATGSAWAVGNTSASPVEGEYFELRLPEAVVARIGAFDSTGGMRPFRFDIDFERSLHDYREHLAPVDLPAEDEI